MRFLLYILWSLVSLLVIVLVSVTALLTVFHHEVEERLVHSIEQYTGRNIVVEGDFGFRFNPRPTVIARDIKMANASWSNVPWMLEIESLQASLSLSSLLRGKLSLLSLEGDKPRVLVEKDPVSQKINWQFGNKRIPRPLYWLAEHLQIRAASVRDAQVKIDVGPIEHNLVLDLTEGETDYFSKLINIQSHGQLDGRSIRLNLTLDNLRNMFLRQPTLTVFDGLHGATNFSGEGEIADLLRWRGHNIELKLSVPSLTEVQGWVTTPLIETPPLSATAQFIQPDIWKTARLDDIKIDSDALDGQTRILGNIETLRGLYGIKLNGWMHYPLASIMRWKGLKSTTDTIVDAEVTLSGDKAGKLRFDVRAASLTGEGVDVRGKGSVDHLLQPDTDGILFKGAVDSLSKIGLINDKKWFETERLEGEFSLRKKQGRLALDQIKINGFEGRAVLEGELDDITRDQQGLFKLSADLKILDVDKLNSLNNLKLAIFEQSEISALIDMKRSDFSARDVSLYLRSKGLVVTANGEIEVIKTLNVKNVELEMKADSIANINAQFGTGFPELGKLQATGTASGDLNNLYNIKVLESSLHNKHQSISASGTLRDLGASMKAKLAVRTDIRSIGNIPPFFDSDIKVPVSFTGEGRATLLAHKADDWSFTDIHIKLEDESQGTLSGSIKHFPGAPIFDIDADFRRISAADLPEVALFDTLNPENIRAFMHITKSPDQEYFTLSDIDSHFSLASGAGSVNLAGSVENMNDFEGLSLNLGLRSSNLNAIPYLTGLSLKDNLKGTGSVKLSGKPSNLGITVTGVTVADSDIRGNLILQIPKGGKPVIKGRLNSKNLDLLSLTQEEKRQHLFSESPLEFDWVNDVDADLSITADHFNGLISQLNHVTITIIINNGVFNMPNMNGTVGEGKMAAWLSIVAQKKPYNIVTSLQAENIKPEHINLFGDSGFIQNGEIDIDIGLGGSGTSIADYVGNSYGKIQLQLHDSDLKHKNLKLFGADLISSVFDIIDTLSREAVYLPIECGVMHFPVVKGKAVASQGIAIKTDKITVLGGGIIDLETEELEIIIRPKARKGLGINAGTVANVAKISGSISKPKIAVDKSALLQSTATIGAAIASGGWSLLAQGLLARNKANSDVCNQTLIEPNSAQFRQEVEVFDEGSGER